MKNRKVYVTTFCGVAVAMNIGTGNPVISGYTGNCAFRSNSWSGTGNHCRSIE